MTNPYKVFHSPCDLLRKNVHIVLVRPEQSANVGAVARAIANMGISGSFRIVGNSSVLNDDAVRIAKHASPRLGEILFFDQLEDAVQNNLGSPSLILAASARIGSPQRPHPLRVRSACQKAISKLRQKEICDLILVFGPEGSGLTNSEIDQCDWVVTIPSLLDYRSLNLAQAVLIFTYEVNLNLLDEWESLTGIRPGQKERLIAHILRLAEEVGFILPDDPLKMKPRLESILSHLPNYIKDVKTLHGLVEQVIRTVRTGEVKLKGRYKTVAKRRALQPGTSDTN